MKLIFSRGPALHLRLILAIFAALVIIVVDSKVNSFREIRSYLDTSVSPFYFLADAPGRLLDNIATTLTSRRSLEKENETLRHEVMIKSSQLQLLEQYRQENIRLRELLGSPLRQDEHKMVTQVISEGGDPYSDQIVINKGSNSGVYEGQPVISDRGVVGQVVAVSHFTSRVLLICDASHALPVQVLRNDVRAIATGSGCGEDLQLEHLSGNSDIRPGDVLVTSGLGGRFPEGYPVGVVSSVRRDAQRAETIIDVQPAAELQRLRYLLLLWNSDNIQIPPPSAAEVQQVANDRLFQMMPQVITSEPHQEVLTGPKKASDANQLLKKENNSKHSVKVVTDPVAPNKQKSNVGAHP